MGVQGLGSGCFLVVCQDMCHVHGLAGRLGRAVQLFKVEDTLINLIHSSVFGLNKDQPSRGAACPLAEGLCFLFFEYHNMRSKYQKL